MRVLQLITDRLGRGPQLFAVELADALRARGVMVETVALARVGDDPRLRVEALGPGPRSPRTLAALRRTAAGFDVVLAQGSSTLLACGVALLGTRVPFVYRNIGDVRYWARGAARRARVRWLMNRAAAVVCQWPGAVDDLRALGVRRPLHVIAGGSSARRFRPVDPELRAEARRSLGVADGEPVALYVGALAPEKRVDLAVEAVARVPGLRLLVAGDGPLRGHLESRAAALAAGRVRFLGAVADPERVMAAADVMVLPSDTEGIPAVLIEAGLTEIPAVATAVGGVPEVVKDGVTGFLVLRGDPATLAEAIRRALAERDRLGRAARERCLARFELGSVADRYAEVLASVTGRNAAGASIGSPSTTAGRPGRWS